MFGESAARISMSGSKRATMDLRRQAAARRMRVFVIGRSARKTRGGDGRRGGATMRTLTTEEIARRRARILDLAHREPSHREGRSDPSLRASESEAFWPSRSAMKDAGRA